MHLSKINMNLSALNVHHTLKCCLKKEKILYLLESKPHFVFSVNTIKNRVKLRIEGGKIRWMG